MDRNLHVSVMGGLLHDIGKLMQRSRADGEDHAACGARLIEDERITLPEKREIIEVIRFHHYEELQEAGLAPDHPAYIVYEADNIAAAADLRTSDAGRDGRYHVLMPLRAVFNMINVTDAITPYSYRPLALNGENEVNFPGDPARIAVTPGSYAALQRDLENRLWQDPDLMNHPHTVMQLLEAVAGYVPSSASLNRIADISLFDHLKLTAAIAGAIYLYFREQQMVDYQAQCLDPPGTQAFRRRPAFLLAAGRICDRSQILRAMPPLQSLEILQAGAFFMHILAEHITDEILESLALSRANLLYSGGGCFSMLLPHTREALQVLESTRTHVNRWLSAHYPPAVRLEIAHLPASAGVLMNSMEDGRRGNRLGELFQQLFAHLPGNKPDRTMSTGQERVYRASGAMTDDLRTLNKMGTILRSSGMNRDPFTVEISTEKKTDVFDLELPSCQASRTYLSLSPMRETGADWKKVPAPGNRVYTINNLLNPEVGAINLWAGMYNSRSSDQAGVTAIEELTAKSLGAGRLAMLRVEVDQAGPVFAMLLKQPDQGISYRFATLSRYVTLSRQLSLFFNNIVSRLARSPERYAWLTGRQTQDERNLAIICSGGEEMLLLGAWNEILDFAVDLRVAWQKFSCRRLAFSAAAVLLPEDEPMSPAAGIYDLLQPPARGEETPDGITLWAFDPRYPLGPDKEPDRAFFGWDLFIHDIIGDKYRLLQEHMAIHAEEIETGKLQVDIGQLWQWLHLLEKEDDQQGVNLLSWVKSMVGQEMSGLAGEEKGEGQPMLQKQLCEWVLHPAQREALGTALHLFILSNNRA